MPTPPRRRPTIPPLSELDAPGRTGSGRGRGAGGGPTPGDGPAPERGGAALWTPPPQADEQAPRVLAEERAQAERAAAGASDRNRNRNRTRVPALAVLGAAGLLLAARLWLVGAGALFGAGPVRALDAAIGLTAALGLALLPASGRGLPRRPAVVLGVPALVVTGTVLLQPATPAFAPAAACPAAPVRGGTATAVTTATATTRSGPGRSHPATGLLPAGCAVGVTGYCLGETLPAAAGWADNRWLLVERQRGPAALVSRHVSGEPERPRFVPAAAATPAGADLPRLPAGECGTGGPDAPGPARLGDLLAPAGPNNLVAQVPRAANVGFAVWVAPDPTTGASPLVRGGQYRQVPGGATGPAGLRWARWDHPALLRDLGAARGVTVAVLAIGCHGPAAPAPAGTAGVTTYQVTDRRLTGPRLRLRGDEVGNQPALAALDLDRLAAEACAPPA